MESQRRVPLEKGSREAREVLGPRAAGVKVGEAAAGGGDGKDPVLTEESPMWDRAGEVAQSRRGAGSAGRRWQRGAGPVGVLF